MKKRRNWLYAGLCILALTGCSLNSKAETTSAKPENQQEQPQDMGTLGKITDIDDEQITLTLADDNMGQGGQPGNGETPPEMPANGETPPEKPADGKMPADGQTPPEKPADGEMPADGSQTALPEMSFNGETKTYSISSSVKVTEGMEQADASVSELEAGTVIRITLDGDTVTGINIMK